MGFTLNSGDGLAAGVVGIVALVLLLAAAGRGGQSDVVVMTGGLAGTCLGFLAFNFHPARIFMGESGASMLGLALALLSVLGIAKVAIAMALAVPVLALAVPIADTALAIIRRRRAGLSIAQPDSRHIHHRLLGLGLSQPQICFLFYAATAILGALGLMLFGHKRILGAVIGLVLLVLATLLSERFVLRGRRLPVPAGRLIRLLVSAYALTDRDKVDANPR